LKLILPAALSFLLLTACSAPSPEVTAEDIQQSYFQAESVTMTLDLTADYGEKVYPYKLACTVSPDGGEIVIKEPEIIAGVRALIESDGVTLSYDGAEVYTGAILPDGLSPVDAVPVMVSLWREGLITETVWEPYGDIPCVAAVFRVSDSVTLRTWFDGETQLPVHAEFSSDGYTVIICDFENVILE